jgi:hypothetical protein
MIRGASDGLLPDLATRLEETSVREQRTSLGAKMRPEAPILRP